MLPSIRYSYILCPHWTSTSSEMKIQLLSSLQLLLFLLHRSALNPIAHRESSILNLVFVGMLRHETAKHQQQRKTHRLELSWLLLVHTKKMMLGESEWKILGEHLQHNLTTERYDDSNGGGRRWRWRWWTSTEYKVKMRAMRMMEIWSLRNDEAVRGRRHVIKIDR